LKTWTWLRVLTLAFASGLGCASYQGSAQDVSHAALESQAGWQRIDSVPLVRQKGAKDCGAAALSSVLRFWDPVPGQRALERESIDAALRTDPTTGLSARELRDYARSRGFFAYVVQGSFEDLVHEVELGRPVIVGVHKPLSSGKALAHYEVFIGYHPEKQVVLTLDPAHGYRQNALDGFMREWKQTGQVTLVVIPEQTPDPRQARVTP
jgi:predicted double-glycine peptidase